MKVHDAIELLKQLDPQDEILIGQWDDTGAYNNYPIDQIVSYCNNVSTIDTSKYYFTPIDPEQL